MKTGEKAIDFKLMGIDKYGEEKEFTLADFAGKSLVLYFYPMDDTPVCTIEANDFNDDLAILSNTVEVVGVSRDDLESHKNFKDKYGLNFVLLSDPDGTVHKDYEALDDMDPEQKHAIRTTFLIDKDGVVRKIWHKVAINGHVEEVLKELKNL